MSDYDDDTYDDKDNTWSESDEGINTYFVVFLSILAFVLILSKFLHDAPRVAAVFPEAGMIIIVGLILGYIIYIATPMSGNNEEIDDDSIFSGELSQWVAEGLLSFSPKIFFHVLLPPIIFNSGYNLKRGVFFRHIVPISLFACLGTAISTIGIAFILEALKVVDLTGGFNPHFTELLTFGALISATDPVSTLAVLQAKKVDPQLFHLVFGESVMNDAVGLVLFHTLGKFVGDEDSAEKILFSVFHFLLDFTVNFAGSMALGLFSGLFTAFFFNKVDMRRTPTLELSLFLLIMYMPFFVSEFVRLSGIVTILFTGISAKRYATQNLSEGTEQNIDALFRVTAHLAETTIFLDLGMSVFGLSFVSSQWIFASWAVLACLIGRALNIYPLRSIYNKSLLWTKTSKRERVISRVQHPQSEVDDDADSVAQSVTPAVKRDLKIRNNTAHMLWFSGLRGAVAYACAKTFPDHYGNRHYFVFTTIFIVFFTVFVFGCTTECALKHLEIEMNVDEDAYMEENDTEIKMIFLNTFENRYIFPYVARDHDLMDGGIELRHAPASTYLEGQASVISHENALNSRRKRSLYDYGIGVSFSRGTSFSTANSGPYAK